MTSHQTHTVSTRHSNNRSCSACKAAAAIARTYKENLIKLASGTPCTANSCPSQTSCLAILELNTKVAHELNDLQTLVTNPSTVAPFCAACRMMNSHSCCTCLKGWLQYSSGQLPAASGCDLDSELCSMLSCVATECSCSEAVNWSLDSSTASSSLFAFALLAFGCRSAACQGSRDALAVSAQHQLGPQANQQCSAGSFNQCNYLIERPSVETGCTVRWAGKLSATRQA